MPLILSLEEKFALSVLNRFLPKEVSENIMAFQQPNKEDYKLMRMKEEWYYNNVLCYKQCYSTVSYPYNDPLLLGFKEEKPVALKEGKFGQYITYNNNNYSIKDGKYGRYVRINNKNYTIKDLESKSLYQQLLNIL